MNKKPQAGSTAKPKTGIMGKSSTGKSSNPLKFGGKNSSGSFTPSTSNKTYSSSSHDTPKNKTTFGIIWIPTRRHNKKKDVVYNSHRNDRLKDRSPTMYPFMSGDSPDNQLHKKKDEETLLVPEKTTTPLTVASTGAAAVIPDSLSDNTSAATPEERQEFITHDREEDKEAAGDTIEKSDKDEKSDNLENNDGVIYKSPENKLDKVKCNEDKVDSVYLRPPPPHKTRSTASTTDDEDCGIKCLYYTLQCCDCVLM